MRFLSPALQRGVVVPRWRPRGLLPAVSTCIELGRGAQQKVWNASPFIACCTLWFDFFVNLVMLHNVFKFLPPGSISREKERFQMSFSVKACFSFECSSLKLRLFRRRGGKYFASFLWSSLYHFFVCLPPLPHNAASACFSPPPPPLRQKKVCADGGVDALTLNITKRPERTFYPNLLEGELQLSLADTYSGSCGGAGGRVAWSVSYRPSPGSAQDEDDWTVFPSTGLLLPGERWVFRHWM